MKANKKTKELLVKKFAEKWLKDNKELVEDYQELCKKVLRLHLYWGIEVGITLKKPVKENKGRGLGCL